MRSFWPGASDVRRWRHAAMIAFTALLERLTATTSPAARRVVLHRYLTTQADPGRGFGLAALVGVRLFPPVGIGLIRGLAAARTDPVLLAASRNFVGDLTETLALMWPAARSNAAPPDLAGVVGGLKDAAPADVPGLVAGWLDACEPAVRVTLLKTLMRGGQPMVMDEVVWDVLAGLFGTSPSEVERACRALEPPYAGWFATIPSACAAEPAATPDHFLNAVLLYAEPNAYTIGVWREDALVPVGKAQAGDSEAAFLDRWVRDHTIARFGMVREVEKTLVLTVSYTAIRAAPRRKAGIELRGARIVGLASGATPADTLDRLLP